VKNRSSVNFHILSQFLNKVKRAVRPVNNNQLEFRNFRSIATRLRRVEILKKGIDKSLALHGADILNINELSRIDPVEFTRQFFYKNLLKNIIACRFVLRYVSRTVPVFDLGCGAGAFSFASREVFKPSNFTAIDININALELISNFHSASGFKIPNLIRADVSRDVLNVSGNVGISYVLSEMSSLQLSSFSKLIHNSVGSNFLIVDYADKIVEFLRICANDRPVKVVIFEYFELNVPHDLVGLLGDDHLSMGVCFVSGGHRV